MDGCALGGLGEGIGARQRTVAHAVDMHGVS
jgi:hypothetical protein